MSLFRFKKEITVVGSDIILFNLSNFKVDSDHSSYVEKKRWHYQFELIFSNNGDRNGILIIDSIENNYFDAIAIMENGVRHLRMFPIKRIIDDGSHEKIKFGGFVKRFVGNEIEETLIINYRTWKKKSAGKFRKNNIVEIIKEETQSIRLLTPKRSKDGIIERLRENNKNIDLSIQEEDP